MFRSFGIRFWVSGFKGVAVSRFGFRGDPLDPKSLNPKPLDRKP